MTDVLLQCFANGATGVSLFWPPYVDDPGVYLAVAQAIDLAAPYEEILLNGTAAAGAVTVHSGNAVASAIRDARHRHFIAISPDAIMKHGGTGRPPSSRIEVTFDSGGVGSMELRDLRTHSRTACASKCRVKLALDATAVFVFEPARRRAEARGDR